MAQRESKLSRKIMEALRAEGWFAFKVHGSALMMSGLNDIIVCAEGYFIGLETKNPDNRGGLEPEQVRVHAKIKAAGGQAIMCSSPKEAVYIVHEWLKMKRAEG